MRGVHVALLCRIILTCNVPTSFLPGLTLCFTLLEVEMEAAIALRYFQSRLLSIARRTCGVSMTNRSCY